MLITLIVLLMKSKLIITMWIRVKNILHEKLFYYNRFQWGISAKLLKLFLEMPKEKMQLHPLTYFWGEKFSPVITRQIVSKLDIMHQE